MTSPFTIMPFFCHVAPIGATEARQAQQPRREAASQRYLGFPENFTVLLDELYSAVSDSESPEQVQAWWTQNKESLVALGATVDTQVDNAGFTALHYAASFDREEIVRYLVGVCGADVNVKEALDGRTPLMLAALNASLASVRALLELGADPNLQDDDGKTALDHAGEMKDQEKDHLGEILQECIEILEQWAPMPSVKSVLKG